MFLTVFEGDLTKIYYFLTHTQLYTRTQLYTCLHNNICINFRYNKKKIKENILKMKNKKERRKKSGMNKERN